MIDTHCHILSGIDDGATDLAHSAKMCRMAKDDGISVICATPHFNDFYPLIDANRVRRLSHELNEFLANRQIPVKVVPGMEIRITADLERVLESGRIMGLGNSRTLLLELHPNMSPKVFHKLAEIIVDKGFRILLAHPEKNMEVLEHPESLFDLVKGFGPWQVISQLTAASVTGQNGRREKRAARVLLEHNLAHVIASDAHDDSSRPPILSTGVEAASRIVGEVRARQMVSSISAALLDESGEFPDWLEPTNPRKWWRIF